MAGIGRAFKNLLPFGKFSDPRVNRGPRRFSQNWDSGDRGLAYMGYCSTITGILGDANLIPCKI